MRIFAMLIFTTLTLLQASSSYANSKLAFELEARPLIRALAFEAAMYSPWPGRAKELELSDAELEKTNQARLVLAAHIDALPKSMALNTAAVFAAKSQLERLAVKKLTPAGFEVLLWSLNYLTRYGSGADVIHYLEFQREELQRERNFPRSREKIDALYSRTILAVTLRREKIPAVSDVTRNLSPEQKRNVHYRARELSRELVASAHLEVQTKGATRGSCVAALRADNQNERFHFVTE